MTKKLVFENSFRHAKHHHRNRQPPIVPDPNEEPLIQIRFYLDRYKIKEALAIFFHERTLDLLRNESDGFIWDLIPTICNRLRGLSQYRFLVYEGCEKMLSRIASDEHCSPKEVLIVLLAELSRRSENEQDREDDNIFRAMLRPLKLTLLRMNKPSPRNENLKWVLNVMKNYINNVELPEESVMSDVKRTQLVNHPRVKRIYQILQPMLEFIGEFSERPSYMEDQMPSIPSILSDDLAHCDYLNGRNNNAVFHDDYRSISGFENGQSDDKDVDLDLLNGELADDDMPMGSNASITSNSNNENNVNDNNNSSRCDNSIEDCALALMSLMYRPLAQLDLTYDRPDLKVSANRYLLTLLKLKPNLFSPMYKLINESNIDSIVLDPYSNMNRESHVAIGVCSFIYNCERLPIINDHRYIPSVISLEYTLYMHAPFIVALLRSGEGLAQEKGLILLEFVFMKFELNSLSEKYLRFFKSSFIHDYLLHIMVYSNLGTNRRRAHNIFVIFCDLLKHENKFELLTSTLENGDYKPSLRATCIDQYRKHLQYLGSSLVKFMKICIETSLPESPRSDVIENYDLLMATLTLFRFLKLRKSPLEGFEDNNGFFEKKNLKTLFFEPLRKGLTITINELKSHINQNRASTELVSKDLEPISETKQTNKSSPSSTTKSKSNKSKASNSSTKNKNEVKAKEQETEIEIEIKNDCSNMNLNGDKRKHERQEKDDVSCLEWLLCRLDLMASVLIQTCELYDL